MLKASRHLSVKDLRERLHKLALRHSFGDTRTWRYLTNVGLSAIVAEQAIHGGERRGTSGEERYAVLAIYPPPPATSSRRE